MIKNPDKDARIINVYLRNGVSYKYKDIPENPFAHKSCIAFWDENMLKIIPMDLIAYIELGY
jgi:hypothetical protein